MSRRSTVPVLVFVLLASAVCSQELRIASYNMERLGVNKKDYATLAKVIATFDVVAAEEVMNAQGMQSVMAQLEPSWSDAISETGEGSQSYKEFFGFFYDGKVEFVKTLGIYPNAKEFFRPPYGAQFKVKGSNLTFNLIACHIVYGSSDTQRAAEIGHLGEVYRYFEDKTGNAGDTIIAGDFNEDKPADFNSLTALGDEEVIPQEGTTIGTHGPDHAYDHMFLPAALRKREISAGVDYWTTDYSNTRKTVSDHFPVYVDLKVGG